ELCWGPWEFLSGLQWFEDPLQGPAAGDPLRVDFRSPAHVLCGAPEYRFTAERAKDAASSTAEKSFPPMRDSWRRRESPSKSGHMANFVRPERNACWRRCVPGDWTAAVSEPTSDGSAVSLAHLGLPSRQELRLTVTCSRAAAVPGRARKEDEAPFRKKIDAQNKTLPVDVLDRNNHPPEMNQKDSVFDIYLCETHNLFKDEHVSNKRGRPRISIVDMDEHHASHYKVHIEGDTAGILALDSATPGIFDLPPGSYPDIQRTASMLFANLKYRRNASPYKEFGPGYNYSVQVVFEDKFLHHSYGDKELRMTVNLLTSCRPPPPTSPPPEVVTVPAGTIFSAAVRRDSARFARVFQLPRELLAGPLHLAPTPDRAHRAFNVTEREGIVYVLKPSRLRELSGVVNLTLLSREGDKSDAPVTVNVTVSVNVTAVTGESDGEAECEQKKNADHCAVESTEKECEQRCGAGAQGRCAWRSPPEGKEMTNEYGTCSPDFRTCPDQRCDELESLWPQICPQDCVARDDRRNGSPLLTYGTHRGVARGRGVCHCEQFTSCTCATGEHVPRPSDRNMTERQRARATVATPRSELAASPEKRVCGTACITGSSLGAVLLLAMMLLVCLIYDSRCGRSSKLRKDPFSGEVISLSHITGDMDLGGRQQMALPPDAQCAISAQLLETVP
ncbi:uncharacterized protein LOC122376850, partial [Amphibalanus amphitrite]|uniref:uncharacterized protein LOC122376850 n=1 Tax=Amphibalanus amphitrite TaxID=1232801 RepID=UPI001C929B52